MPLKDAILASKGLLNHVSKDDLTPVIMCAAVLEYEGKKYLVGTDRYSYGRFELTDADEVNTAYGQMIPTDALVWVSKIIAKGLRRGLALDSPKVVYSIQYTWTKNHDNPNSELEVVILFEGKPERSQTFDVGSGLYPPIVRLWRQDDYPSVPAVKVKLAHQSLIKIAADLALFSGKDGFVDMNFDAKDGKHGPIQYALGTRWTAAVQPGLLGK
jgi:hypothetical protein